MKVTNNDALLAYGALLNSGPLGIKPKAGYKLSKNKRILKGICEDIEDSRQRILESFGAKPNGSGWQLDDAGAIEFESDKQKVEAVNGLNELMAIEVDVNLKKVKLDEFGDGKIDFSLLDAIYFMIRE